jgi:hypothetical protein
MVEDMFLPWENSVPTTVEKPLLPLDIGAFYRVFPTRPERRSPTAVIRVFDLTYFHNAASLSIQQES